MKQIDDFAQPTILMPKKGYKWVKIWYNFLDDFNLRCLMTEEDGHHAFFIYYSVMLLSIHHGGVLKFNDKRGFRVKELAMLCRESEEDITKYMKMLVEYDLIVDEGEGIYSIPYVRDSVKVAKSSTERVREHRARKKAEKLAREAAGLAKAETGGKTEGVVPVAGSSASSPTSPTSPSSKPSATPVPVTAETPPSQSALRNGDGSKGEGVLDGGTTGCGAAGFAPSSVDAARRRVGPPPTRELVHEVALSCKYSKELEERFWDSMTKSGWVTMNRSGNVVLVGTVNFRTIMNSWDEQDKRAGRTASPAVATASSSAVGGMVGNGMGGQQSSVHQITRAELDSYVAEQNRLNPKTISDNMADAFWKDLCMKRFRDNRGNVVTLQTAAILFSYFYEKHKYDYPYQEFNEPPSDFADMD